MCGLHCGSSTAVWNLPHSDSHSCATQAYWLAIGRIHKTASSRRPTRDCSHRIGSPQFVHSNCICSSDIVTLGVDRFSAFRDMNERCHSHALPLNMHRHAESCCAGLQLGSPLRCHCSAIRRSLTQTHTDLISIGYLDFDRKIKLRIHSDNPAKHGVSHRRTHDFLSAR